VHNNARALDETDVYLCAVVVKQVHPSPDGELVSALVKHTWSQRTLEGWALTKAGPKGGAGSGEGPYELGVGVSGGAKRWAGGPGVG
jgi:hypothetical protein